LAVLAMRLLVVAAAGALFEPVRQRLPPGTGLAALAAGGGGAGGLHRTGGRLVVEHPQHRATEHHEEAEHADGDRVDGPHDEDAEAEEHEQPTELEPAPGTGPPVTGADGGGELRIVVDER